MICAAGGSTHSGVWGELQCGSDVEIDVNCVFEGRVSLGDGVRIGANCVIRNAMIAPFTVILLQINFLISGVVVTEMVFAYPGFGRMILDASLFGDIALIEAASSSRDSSLKALRGLLGFGPT